jgi:hypothetical protein
MLEILIEYLKKKKWSYGLGKEDGVIIFNLSGQNGTFPCIADIQASKTRFIFVTICPSNCPNHKKAIIAELLTRLNFFIYYGTFEMNYDNGEIRFKTSIPLDHLTLTEDIIDDVIMSNISIMDECSPAILRLIYGSELTALDTYSDLIESATRGKS